MNKYQHERLEIDKRRAQQPAKVERLATVVRRKRLIKYMRSCGAGAMSAIQKQNCIAIMRGTK